MTQAMDAHSSFVSLIDNLPTWRASIDSLSVHAAERNADFVAEYARLVNRARPKRRKSPSVSSIHIDDQDPANDQADAPDGIDGLSSPDPQHINPFEAGNKYLYAQARRKRKPGPSIRSGASGTPKLRNKNHFVVYYDGYLQEQLDSMVKQLGLGRNNLRKGKAALAAAKGFQLPPLTSRAGYGLAIFDDIRPSMVSRSTSALLPAKKRVAPLNQPASDDEASFLQADKELEQIQSLCETAAHQFLRDGDCKAELDSIRQKFDGLLVYATATAESLKKLQEVNQEASQADSSASDSNHGCTYSNDALSTQPSLNHLHSPRIGATKDHSPLAVSQPLYSLKPEGFFSGPAIPTDDNGLTTHTIEVDDASDQESIIVDLSQYRLNNTRRIRG